MRRRSVFSSSNINSGRSAIFPAGKRACPLNGWRALTCMKDTKNPCTSNAGRKSLSQLCSIYPRRCVLPLDDGCRTDGDGPDDMGHIIQVQSADLVTGGMIGVVDINLRG